MTKIFLKDGLTFTGNKRTLYTYTIKAVMINEELRKLGAIIEQNTIHVSLLTRAQVIHAMSLNTAAVKDVLKASGYSDEFLVSDFRGMSAAGTFVYEILYYDIGHAGMASACKIYLNYVREEGAANFTLQADY